MCGGACGSADNLEWRENDGAGTIYSYAVVSDTPIAALQADQPFNCAVVSLDHAPGIVFLSHLPGSAPGDVPINGKVNLTFEETQATGQKVPEWTVAKSQAVPADLRERTRGQTPAAARPAPCPYCRGWPAA